MTPEAAAALRKPFPASAVGKLPRAGTTLDYVGHAAVTDRLLDVDPEWSWEPVAFAENGAPLIVERGTDSVLWIRLTVAGVTRLGVGIAASKTLELEKQLVSDALRNAAMRFGVALELWTREELPHAEPSEETVSKHRRDAAKSRAMALQADNVSVADARAARNLPPIDKSTPAEMDEWESLLDALEGDLSKPFAEAAS